MLDNITHFWFTSIKPNQKNCLQAENDAVGQELQKQLEAAGKIVYIFLMENYVRYLEFEF